MPIYEYRCRTCEAEFQRLVMKAEEEAALTCPACGGRDISRLISRVAYHVSEGDRLASFDPNARQDDSFYKDTRNIGLQAKKRAQQMGVDLGPAFESKVEKLRTNPGSVFDSSE
ncbi:MAG: zinc ribbon domain-containing protein [Deltaproteobacteria bacterium]|nr:zinc ribbon domain-containing protein [Deltaproteobacteria bacterium]